MVDGLDVMNDQLEGVLTFELKLLVQKYIDVDKHLTLDIHNERISSFSYPSVDACRRVNVTNFQPGHVIVKKRKI